MEVLQTRRKTRFQRKLDDLRDFPSCLDDFFQPFIKSANEGRSFEWSSVDKFYNDFEDKLSITYALKNFCQYVLKLFLYFNCGEERLLKKISYIYTQVETRRHGNIDAMSCEDCRQMNCRTYHHLNARPLLKKVNERLDRVYNVPEFIITDFYMYGSTYPFYDFVRYLVKYGLIYIPDCVEDVLDSFLELRFDYYDERERQGDILLDHFTTQDDEILFNQLLASMSIQNLRRLFLVMEVVGNYLTLKGNRDHATHLTLYALSISEPVISQKEVQEFLDFSFADDEIFKRNAISSFINVFADSPELPSPRSLKHLCRCKIRDCLPRSPPMPAMLHKIEMLPNYLKDYILFHTD